MSEYDAFASHATDPDGALVRRVKATLEGFHKRAGVPERYADASGGTPLEPLTVCVDGLDFVFPKAAPDKREPVVSLIKDYLSQSRDLLVFSGTHTRHHPWINKEIEWFRELRPDGNIYVAFTHGARPAATGEFMPAALRDDDGSHAPLFFDLRGHYRQSALMRWLQDGYWRLRSPVSRQSRRMHELQSTVGSWESVRAFDEEISRLAARLISDRGGQEFSVEHLERSFEQARRARYRRRLVVTALTGFFLIASTVGIVSVGRELSREQTLRTNRVWSQQADLLREDLSATLLESLVYSVNAVANGNYDDAPRGLVQTMQRLVKTEHLYPGPATSDRPAHSTRRPQVEAVATLDKGARLVFGGYDSHLILFDPNTRTVLDELNLAAGRIQAIVRLADTDWLGVATQKGLHIVQLIRP